MSRFFAVCAVLCLGWFLYLELPTQMMPKGQDTVYVTRSFENPGIITSQEMNEWVESGGEAVKFLRF